MRSHVLGYVLCVLLTSACGGEEVQASCERSEATSCPSACDSIAGGHFDAQRNCLTREVIACREQPELPIVSGMMQCFVRRPSDGELFLVASDARPDGWAIEETPANFDWSSIEECPTPTE
ncbi:MAG: hypothetical protein RBU37_25080 [Myxococcota bacterium]|nr:hypothetical protein [Myxococcota bacterium]